MKSKIHKLLAVLAAVALLCTVLPLSGLVTLLAAETNLVINGDFESGSVGATASNWKQYDATYPSLVSTEDAHGGSQSIKLSYRQSRFVLYQDVTVEANTDYTISLYYRYTATTDTRVYRLGAYTTGSNGNVGNGGGTLIDSTATEVDTSISNTEWTKLSYTFNSGSNTTVRLGVSGISTTAKIYSADGFALVDDIVMTTKAVASFDGYITNGDFEVDDLSAWKVSQGSISDALSHGGSQSLYSADSLSQYSYTASCYVNVEANTNYNITFWYSYVAGTAKTMRLYVHDGADDGTTNIKAANNDSQPVVYCSDTTATAGVWKQATLSFNSGANTSLLLKFGGGSGGYNAVYLDDIVMTKVTGELEYQGTAQKDKTAGADIRMMTYNVLVDKDEANGGYDWSSETATIDVRAPKAIAMIKYYQPDVIALEEFSGNWYTYFRNDLTDYAFAETASLDSQNNGLLYTTLVYNTKTVRLLDTELHGLTNTRWGKQGMRYVNVGFFEVIATGEKFIACATHTDAGSLTGTSDVNGDGVAAEGDGYWRQFQTAEIAEILNELSATHKMPVLCGGDYNCSGEETASYSKLTEAGLTDSTSGRYIDHIFYNAMVTHLYDVTVTDAAVAGASDHNAVFGDFQFLDEYATPISQLMSGIKQQGRNYMKNGVLWLDFSASGIEFTANCEGDVAVNFVTNSIKNTDATYGGVYFTVIVDGVQKERAQCRITATGTTTLTLAEDLPAGNHTFEIYRQTEHRGAEVGIGSIVMNGTIGTKPSDNTFFIEFIGDSISTGYGALGVSGNEQADSPKWQDATAAYPYLTAKALGVDFSDVCYSGIGAKYGWQDPNMHTFYPYQRYQYDRTTQYNFTNREPNLIVIALGTNDIAMETEKGITVEQRMAGYQEFLDLVRAKNPNSKIVWIYNMMKSDDNTRIAELIEENGGAAEGLYSLQLTQNTAGAGWHPSAAGQQKFADELVAFINANNLLTLGDEEDAEGLITAEGSSVMDIVDGKMGVGFLFDVKVSGITKNEAHIGDYTNATVTIDGVEYKLIKMGAVVTNRVTIGVDEEQMKLTNPEIASGSGKVLDIFAEKVYEAGADNAKFAVRIKNIPEAHRETVIYARPYYVIEKGGEEITVYADIVGRSYDEKLDVNDDEFEW